MRKRALRETLSTDKLIELGRTIELVDQQANEMESNESRHYKESVLRIGDKSFSPKQSTFQQQQQCGYCGYQHKQGSCPAKGKKCRKCDRLNHFEKVCRSTAKTFEKNSANEVNNVSSENFGKNKRFEATSESIVKVEICKTEITTMIDTGSTLNILDEQTCNTIASEVTLSQTKSIAWGFQGKKPIEFISEFSTTVNCQTKHYL